MAYGAGLLVVPAAGRAVAWRGDERRSSWRRPRHAPGSAAASCD